MKNKIVIGSRESRLAVIQSRMVQEYLQAQLPQVEIDILTMKTTGDKILNQSLDKVGGKGLFVKELDHALIDGRSDLSVHSLKDVPMEVPEALPLIAFSRREDPRDALVLPLGATEIDFSKPIGCSSKRRMIQFQKLYPQAKFAAIRGNVQTRLRRLDEGEFSATLLAAAGLKRLGLEYRISRYFTPEEMVPAAGQGILAVQGRAGEDCSCLAGYNDREAEACALAERSFVRGLGGGCSEPIAAYASIKDDVIILRAFYQDERTQKIYTGTVEGSIEKPEQTGRRLAEQFLKERADGNRSGMIPGSQDRKRRSGQSRADQNGKVWLVGAGPSDPGLFTLKGYQVLADAEVVVYDALVGSAILGMIPETAEAINVGKRSSHHTLPQEEISELLSRKAREGKRVVRLKGGDPFLFGRGGEELEVLVRDGVPFEIVPGVTSAIAVPAYQGIPVTHRDYCSSVHIITGHKKQGQEYDIDFDALVRTGGTLIFLMGAASLETICGGLLRAGMNPQMPAALLAQGTTAAQKRIAATVSTLAHAVSVQGAKTPAIIVVGEVCSLARNFAWVEKLPLGGVRVLVTRPKELAGTTSQRIRELGAEVLELPAICTVPRENNTALAQAFAQIETYQWIVFTSPTGVRVFFEELSGRKIDIRRLSRVKMAVIGQGSAKELEKMGFYPDLMPEIYDGAHLGEALAKACRPGDRVLVPRAAAGSRELTEALAAAENLTVDDIATYDTLYGMQGFRDRGMQECRDCEMQECGDCGMQGIREDRENEGANRSGIINIKAEMENGSVDYVIFTSASTVKGFAAAVGTIDYEKVKAICIGRQTKAAADELGMCTWMAEQATIDSLIEKLVQVHRENKGIID